MEAIRKVAVIGSNGFVGSALCKHLQALDDVRLYAIHRGNFDEYRDVEFDVLIEAACNSKKYLADNAPLKEAELSLMHRIDTLTRFKSRFHIHLSSVDVYSELSDPLQNSEDADIDVARCSHYGAHKFLAEELVRHYADCWAIFRLSGMVGYGLRKNPIYDLVSGGELYIHPHSKYQFISTQDVARVIWEVYERGITQQIFNIAGKGMISPQEIHTEFLGDGYGAIRYNGKDSPRVVNVNIDKIERLVDMSYTHDAVSSFLKTYKPGANT